MDVPALAAGDGCFAEKDIIYDITVKEPEIIVTIYMLLFQRRHWATTQNTLALWEWVLLQEESLLFKAARHKEIQLILRYGILP